MATWTQAELDAIKERAKARAEAIQRTADDKTVLAISAAAAERWAETLRILAE